MIEFKNLFGEEKAVIGMIHLAGVDLVEKTARALEEIRIYEEEGLQGVIIEDYHGTEVTEDYRWLENYENKDVKEWVAKQEKLTHSVIDKLPQKKKIIERLNELLKYDEETVPLEVLKSKRIFFYKRKKTDEKWAYYTKEDIDSSRYG